MGRVGSTAMTAPLFPSMRSGARTFAQLLPGRLRTRDRQATLRACLFAIGASVGPRLPAAREGTGDVGLDALLGEGYGSRNGASFRTQGSGSRATATPRAAPATGSSESPPSPRRTSHRRAHRSRRRGRRTPHRQGAFVAPLPARQRRDDSVGQRSPPPDSRTAVAK